MREAEREGKEMKAAVIGLGTISPLHIRAIRDAGGEIAAVCDLDPDKLERAREQAGGACRTYTDYRQMLDEESFDVVHICTPHFLHAEMICACLDRDISVLSEKPLAISRAQLVQIEKSVVRTEAQLAVCQQNRFNASVRYLKELLKDQKILAASGNLCWRRDAAYYNTAAWRGTLLQEGGGVMINQALHTLDLLQWFCGMPSSVIGHNCNDTLKGVIQTEESQLGIFKLKEGGRFILTATNACSYSFPVTLMFKSEDTEAVLIGDNMIINGKFMTKTDGLPLFGKEEWGVGHSNLVREFYACLREKRKFPIDFYEGKKVVELILALYASRGKEIFVEAREHSFEEPLLER